MTGDIVNLRRFRKQRARAEAEVAAAANRATFGRNKTETSLNAAARHLEKRHLDGHRLPHASEREDG